MGICAPERHVCARRRRPQLWATNVTRAPRGWAVCWCCSRCRSPSACWPSTRGPCLRWSRSSVPTPSCRPSCGVSSVRSHRRSPGGSAAWPGVTARLLEVMGLAAFVLMLSLVVWPLAKGDPRGLLLPVADTGSLYWPITFVAALLAILALAYRLIGSGGGDRFRLQVFAAGLVFGLSPLFIEVTVEGGLAGLQGARAPTCRGAVDRHSALRSNGRRPAGRVLFRPLRPHRRDARGAAPGGAIPAREGHHHRPGPAVCGVGGVPLSTANRKPGGVAGRAAADRARRYCRGGQRGLSASAPVAAGPRSAVPPRAPTTLTQCCRT